MKLLTKELEKEFAKIGSQAKTPPEDQKIIAKFFCPWNQWTWYATEYDPEEKTFFGLVFGAEKEWGYFSLEELESARGSFGLRIERDLHFGSKTISDIS